MHFEAKEILSTHVEVSEGNDRRFWKHNAKGIYTVSSGYKWIATKQWAEKHKHWASGSRAEKEW